MPEQVQKEFLKLNGITLENKIVVMEDATSARKRKRKKSLKSFVVTSKQPENRHIFNSSKLSAGMKTCVGTLNFQLESKKLFDPKKEKILYYR